MVDVAAVLVDGSYHDVDSNEMAFKIAGSMVFEEAYARASRSTGTGSWRSGSCRSRRYMARDVRRPEFTAFRDSRYGEPRRQ